MNRSQIEKMLMASGGITGEPVQTARIGSYMTSTGGGQKPQTVTQRTTSGGGSTTQRKSSANVAKANADSQLNRLVNKSRSDSNYRNLNNVYTSNQVTNNNLINLNPDQQAFVNRNRRKDGSFNSAAQAIINNSGKGFVIDNGKAVVDNVTSYQRDLQNFRTASPANEAAYVRRFPKTAAFQSLLAKGAEGIVGTPGRIVKQIASNYLDGVQNMIEKFSGTDAKNVEIAKDKDTDIDTIVNNLQRNIKDERDEGKARGMSEADLTAMYGEPIDIETGDDIFGADLIGMDELEEDSPLNAPGTFVPPEDRVPTPIRETRTQAPGDETAADTQGFTPIRLDRTVGDEEGLFDLAGTNESGEVSPFTLDPNQTYFDVGEGRVVDPGDLKAIKNVSALNMFLRPNKLTFDLLDDSQAARREAAETGLPDIDVTQEQKFDSNFYVNNPIEGQATAAGQGLVYADGSPIMEQGPTPLFDSDIDEEAIRRAIEGKANGGQIFGNQNMSTFDKLKAIADGIADNK